MIRATRLAAALAAVLALSSCAPQVSDLPAFDAAPTATDILPMPAAEVLPAGGDSRFLTAEGEVQYFALKTEAAPHPEICLVRYGKPDVFAGCGPQLPVSIELSDGSQIQLENEGARPRGDDWRPLGGNVWIRTERTP